MTAPHWFPFYWKDFLADDKVTPMGAEARGACLMLLIAQWQAGSLADDPAAIRSKMLQR